MVFNRRIVSHFDFVLVALVVPLVLFSGILIKEIHPVLAQKHVIYVSIGVIVFSIFLVLPIRRFSWMIPFFYWVFIALLVMVEFFGVSKLGAQRWIEIPFVNFTMQPSEFMKPAFLLMLGYLIQKRPPPEEGYGLKDFLILSFYILLPFLLILQEPDLGTALILLLIGYGILFMVGVYWKIWATLFISLLILSPLLYANLHDYQKKRIKDFISEKPSYHVQQSIIAIGSGGMTGKDKDEATQTQMKFLPIASSDFIFAYVVERFGFLGGLALIVGYALLILHLFSLYFLVKDDYYIKVVSMGLSLLLFTHMAVNILMTIGMAPVVGLPLPLFSYGGSSFVNFMIIFGILEHLLAFRFNFMYNTRENIRR
jgi:rod shape determining protein RodA